VLKTTVLECCKANQYKDIIKKRENNHKKTSSKHEHGKHEHAHTFNGWCKSMLHNIKLYKSNQLVQQQQQQQQHQYMLVV